MSTMPPPPPAAAPFNPQPSAPRGKGLAIASMVLGIAAFLLPIAGIIGLILGIVSLAKKKAGKGFAIAGIICSVAGPALMIPILMISLGQARELAKRASCGTHLNSIGMAVLMYQSENNDQFPPDLNALVRAGQPAGLFICPSATRGRTSDYFYAPAPTGAPLSTIIACDLAGNHKDFRNVLVASGSITNMHEAEFQAALAKPENADFAAKLRQAEGK